MDKEETQTTENKNVTVEKKSSKKIKKDKKKLPLGLRLLLLPLKILLVLVAIILVWFVFCRIDRTKPVNALPPDYAVYLRTDKIWDTVEPLIDLDATLIALTTPQLKQYRDPFLNFKKSKLRQNFMVKMALKRRLDAAVYQVNTKGKTEFVAVLDAGFLAGATRLVPLLLPHIKSLADQVELCQNSHGKYYKLQDSGYFVIHKNLIIFASKPALLEQAMNYKNSAWHSKAVIAAMNARLRDPLRIIADSKNLMNLLAEGADSPYLLTIIDSLSKEEFTSVNFRITENELNFSLNLPLELDSVNENQPVIRLLKRNSKVPALLPKLPEDVQYYTLFSAGSLSDLIDAAMVILPPEKNFKETWNKADSVAKMILNKNLEELLFSWTADEFAVFGIEGKAEPVLGIKVSSESKRREIFDTIFSSFIIQENDSLLVDGVRLPCIELPSFLLSITKALGINVPKPYYLVKDDFIYFSKSPENLIAINSTSKSKKLSASENWKRVSSKHSAVSTVSLYYNLERSIPFFVRGNSAVSKILALYNSGRFDFRINNGTLTMQLQASSLEPESSRYIPGFPISLERKSNAVLVKSNLKKSNLIFWTEKDSTINSMDCSTFERQKTKFSEIAYILAASESTAKSTGGELWALTSSGIVYLLDSKLEPVSNFPILTGIVPTCAPFIYKDSFGLADNEGVLHLVNGSGNVSLVETGVDDAIRSSPSVNGDILAFYEKGFFGGIHVYKNLEAKLSEPLELDGIAYGSPCVFTISGKQYIAMITQAGLLYVYDFEGNILPNFPVELEGIFYLNVKAADKYLFALSAEGELYRVDMKGESTSVKIPYFTAKSGNLTVYNYNGSGPDEIFVSGEGNSLYGFNSSLELLPTFPVPGYGNPVFMDLNGDNKKDCLTITFDNTISAANVLK